MYVYFVCCEYTSMFQCRPGRKVPTAKICSEKGCVYNWGYDALCSSKYYVYSIHMLCQWIACACPARIFSEAHMGFSSNRLNIWWLCLNIWRTTLDLYGSLAWMNALHTHISYSMEHTVPIASYNRIYTYHTWIDKMCLLGICITCPRLVLVCVWARQRALNHFYYCLLLFECVYLCMDT